MFFYAKWRFVFPALLMTGFIFCIWDIIFTYLGVWGFNEKYHLGITFLMLPLEEIMFFMVVPFSCFFIYETVYFLWRDKIKNGFFYQITLIVGILLFFIGAINFTKLYTLLACWGSSILLFYHSMVKKQLNHEVLWVSYVIILIPFSMVNGILTGFFTEEPIVWYNNAENLGIRFFTIPIEDFAYNLMLLLLNVTIYEKLLKRNHDK